MANPYHFTNFGQLQRHLERSRTPYEVKNNISIINVEIVEDTPDFKVIKQMASNGESAIIICYNCANQWRYWYPREYHFPALLRTIAYYYEQDLKEKLLKQKLREEI